MGGPSRTALAVAGVAVALSVSAPGGAVTAAASSPRLAFAKPSLRGVGQPQTFAVKVTDFRLTTAGLGKRATRGAGHLHFTMDGGRFDRAPYTSVAGALAREAARSTGRYTPSARASITYRRLPAGRHTLVAQLVDSLNRKVGAPARLTFSLQEGPAPGPSGPPTLRFEPLPTCPCGLPAVPQTYTFVLHVTNFRLSVARLGQTAVKGEGHIRFIMDGGRLDGPATTGANYTAAPAVLAAEARNGAGQYSPSVTGSIKYEGMPPGQHTLEAVLVDNMRNPIGVSEKVEFGVS